MPAKSSSKNDMCSEFGVWPRTLRFQGPTVRASPACDGNHRLYCKTDRARLRSMLRAKRSGFSLDDIADVQRRLKWGERLLAALERKGSNG